MIMRDFQLAYFTCTKRIPAPENDEKCVCHDLTFVKEGEFDYEINGERFTVKAGEIMYCPEGGKRVRFPCREPVAYTSLNLFFEPKVALPLPYHMTGIGSEELNFRLAQLTKAAEGDGTWITLECDALCELVVCEVLRLWKKHSENRYVKETKELIGADLSKRLTLAELAEAVHLNPSYLSELFSKETGQSVSDYAAGLRLDRVKELLAEGATVRAAAEAAGFCDAYYLSHAFHKAFGVSPSAYSRACRDAAKGTDFEKNIRYHPESD